MNNQPIAFLFCSNNTMLVARQLTSLLSLNYTDSPKSTTYTKGVFLIESSFRKSLVLFSIRQLPKHTWINSHNLFLGRD